MANLQEQFGGMDIYLFDQILRGNISPGMKIMLTLRRMIPITGGQYGTTMPRGNYRITKHR
jgi:hypothetical protein